MENRLPSTSGRAGRSRAGRAADLPVEAPAQAAMAGPPQVLIEAPPHQEQQEAPAEVSRLNDSSGT